MSDMESLPDELLLLIAENLSTKELFHFLCTCSRISNLFVECLQKIGLQDIHGVSALEWAIRKNHISLVNLVVANGVDVNCIKNLPDVTPLHLTLTIKKSNPEITRTLIAHGASLDALDSFDRTPLYLAVMFGQEQQVEDLLRFGANISGTGPAQGGLEHLAARKGTIRCMRALIMAGIDIQTKGYQGQTVLHQASTAGNLEIVRYLLMFEAGRAMANSRDSLGKTPLHALMTAYYLGRYDGQWCETIKLLVCCGADIHAKDHEGDTPMHKAIRNNDQASIYQFVFAGIDLNMRDNSRQTIFQAAVRHVELATIQYLLETKGPEININARDTLGMTALHFAVLAKNLDKVRLLLKYGAETEWADFDQNTPPFLAVVLGQHGMVESFKKAGANINFQGRAAEAIRKTQRYRQDLDKVVKWTLY